VDTLDDDVRAATPARAPRARASALATIVDAPRTDVAPDADTDATMALAIDTDPDGAFVADDLAIEPPADDSSVSTVHDRPRRGRRTVVWVSLAVVLAAGATLAVRRAYPAVPAHGISTRIPSPSPNR
jgi:hypothetical protein